MFPTNISSPRWYEGWSPLGNTSKHTSITFKSARYSFCYILRSIRLLITFQTKLDPQGSCGHHVGTATTLRFLPIPASSFGMKQIDGMPRLLGEFQDLHCSHSLLMCGVEERC